VVAVEAVAVAGVEAVAVAVAVAAARVEEAAEASAAVRRPASTPAGSRRTRPNRPRRSGPQNLRPGVAWRARQPPDPELQQSPRRERRFDLDLSQARHQGSLRGPEGGEGSTRIRRERPRRGGLPSPAPSSSCHSLSRLIRHRLTCPFCRSSERGTFRLSLYEATAITRSSDTRRSRGRRRVSATEQRRRRIGWVLRMNFGPGRIPAEGPRESPALDSPPGACHA
jgi:hypothetical protein